MHHNGKHMNTKDNQSPTRMPNGTNVRFDKVTQRRVDRIAKKYRLKKATLIRSAVEAKLLEWETKGVVLQAIEAA